MSEPIKMEKHLQRADYANGKLTIVFSDTAHLADSWAYANKIGKIAAFETALLSLIRMAIGRTVPQNAFTYEGTTHEAKAGGESTLNVWPDSSTQPSFSWSESPKGLSGGLIFHNSDSSWGIHT